MAGEAESYEASPEFQTDIAAVGAAENVAIDGVVVRRTIEGATDPSMSGHHLPSMLQDLINSRATEIEHLNGEIVRRGREHHIPTPANEMIWHLIRMAEATRSHRVNALPH